ncbi:11099_t:CDS:2, partial [Racocetra persica]
MKKKGIIDIICAKSKFNETKSQYQKTKSKKTHTEYIKATNDLYKAAYYLSNHTETFEILQKIQNEGNEETKGIIKFKLGRMYLGGFVCKKNIFEGLRLTIEATRNGHTNTRAWVNNYDSSDDFGASIVIKRAQGGGVGVGIVHVVSIRVQVT